MNELCLFAGGGGGLLATKHLLGFRTVCYVEWDPYCQRVLQARIRDSFLDDAPIWDDVRTFDGLPWKGCVDIVTAGFPCQPFSGAGKQAGEDDERNMWPETIRIIREVGPRFCLLENVPGLRRFDYFGTILGDLAEAGFDAKWKIISAAECGAPHLRKRLWIVADTTGDGRGDRQSVEKQRSDGEIGLFTDAGVCSNVRFARWWDQDPADASDTNSESGGRGREGSTKNDTRYVSGIEGSFPRNLWTNVESGLGRVVDGMADRMDRLRTIGNGQVSAVAARAWLELNPFENEKS